MREKRIMLKNQSRSEGERSRGEEKVYIRETKVLSFSTYLSGIFKLPFGGEGVLRLIEVSNTNG